MTNIEQSICDAIEVITNNAISKAGFDRTIQATIVACMNEATGKYKIKYQDSLLYAYSADVEKRYSKGNRVYILVPGNDDTKDKTIIGIVGQSEEYIASDYGTKYEKFGNNFIYRQPDDWYKIYSGTEYNYDSEDNKNNNPLLCERYGKVIYQYGELKDLELIREQFISLYLDEADYIYLGARFKTTFPEPVYNGEYGLKVLLECRDPQDSNKSIFQSITLDFSHGIDGEFYSFNIENGVFKDFYFQKPNDFIRIYRIEFFAKKFDKQLTDPVPEGDVDPDSYDLFVKGLQMYAANEVTESSYLEVIKEYGNTLLLNDTRTFLKARAVVKENGKIMDASANNFYWFKQDLSVTSVQNSKYCNLGGLGWACLNDKDINNGDWISHSDTFYFEDGVHLLSFSTNFKVVSYRQVGDKIIQYEKEFYLLDDKRNITSEIVVTPDNFPLPRTTVANLICNVERPLDSETHTYRYYWSAEIGNIVYTHDNLNTAPFYRIQVDEESQKTKVITNRINNVYLNTIFSYYNKITFFCTTQELINGNYVTLCTTNKVIPLADMYSADSYEFKLINGTQVFTYDEYGDSPSKNGTYLPPALGIELKDRAGNDINIYNEIIANNLTVEWIIPDNPTLLEQIEPDELVNGNYLKVNYKLKSPYNPNGLDSNVIKVIVTYNGIRFERSTNFIFLTQGSDGTNGTSYTAVIVPNGDVDLPKWVTFFTTWNKVNDEYIYSNEGYLNFGPTLNTNFIIDETGSRTTDSPDPIFPFKILINGGGSTIFEGNKSGIDIFGNDVELKWEMNIFNYGSTAATTNFINDRSNFSIDFNEIGDTPILKYNPLLYDYDDENPQNKDKKIHDRENNEFTPANVLQCRIKYIDSTKLNEENIDVNDSKEFYLYASIPIVKVVNENNFELELDQTSGYIEVIYNRDGCMPHYDSNSNFFTIKGKNDFFDDILKNSDSACDWEIKGHNGFNENNNLYDYKEIKNLYITEQPYSPSPGTTTKHVRSIQIDPVYEFNGSSSTNGILFTYKTNQYNSYINIPIDIHLNRYGLAMLNDWDGNSITINEDGGYILAPQIGAGYKEDDNSFTGIVMGEAKEASQKDLHTGLYGYYRGQRSFGLMADTGASTFGFKGSSQIVIDPQANKGLIYSGNLFTDTALDKETGMPSAATLENLESAIYEGTRRTSIFNNEGMLIDFTNGDIYYGNDKFHLNKDGNIRSQEGHFSNNRYSIFSDQSNNQKETCFVDLKQYDENNYEAGDEYFLYCFNKNKGYSNPKANFSVTKDGRLVANAGQIGGFYISDSYISSYDDIHVPIHGGESVITLSTEQFDRQMKVVGAGYYDTDDVSLIPDDILIENSDPILTPYNDISKLLKEQDFNTIRYKKYNLGTLLFAIGDDFAVTENGSIYVRNVYGKGGLFLDLVCQNFYVKKKAEIQELIVKKDLDVGHKARIGGDTTIWGDYLTVHGKTTTDDFSTFSGYAYDFTVEGRLNTSHIFTPGELIVESDDIYNTVYDLAIPREQLPWMRYSNIDQPPISLAPGHIYLIYED